jgi:hypothetical protein
MSGSRAAKDTISINPSFEVQPNVEDFGPHIADASACAVEIRNRSWKLHASPIPRAECGMRGWRPATVPCTPNHNVTTQHESIHSPP